MNIKQGPIYWEVFDDHASASSRVTSLIAEHLACRQAPVLGLATGGTPVDVYRELVARHREQTLTFSHATTFNLDEYLGLALDHPKSYHSYMREHLFSHVDLSLERTHLPDGTAEDPKLASKLYEDKIAAAGGISLQLLGIGTNGHIGFNEPMSSFASRTRVVNLSSETISANSRFFESVDEVPRQAITMGIATILEAEEIILLATGESKVDAVASAILKPASESNPASALQNHSNVRFVLDRSAARGLL